MKTTGITTPLWLRKKVKRLNRTQNQTRKRNPHDVMVLLAATAGIIFLSTAVVLIVRAYLTAHSGEKNNNFSPLTYTNTEILEQNGELYTFSSATENPSTHKYSTTISKPAVVHNLEGKDKKPVYIRVAVKYNAYKLVVPDDPNAQSYEVNVTPDYPVTLSFTPGNGWERSLDDGYLYYSYVVVPGGSTDPVFAGDNVTLIMDKEPEDDVYFHIDLVADTVQAVSTDSAKWTSSDFEKTDAQSVWTSMPETVRTETKP